MEFVLTLLCAVSLAVGVFFAFTGVFGILKSAAGKKTAAIQTAEENDPPLDPQ